MSTAKKKTPRVIVAKKPNAEAIAKSDSLMIAASIKRADAAKANHAIESKKRKKTARADSTHNLNNEGVHDLNSPARQAAARTRISRDSDLPETWVRPTALNAPPPRPNFVNRWIRFRTKNDEDRDNLDRAMSQGWRPIPKSKIGKEHQARSDLDGASGKVVAATPRLLRREATADDRIHRPESSPTA